MQQHLKILGSLPVSKEKYNNNQLQKPFCILDIIRFLRPDFMKVLTPQSAFKSLPNISLLHRHSFGSLHHLSSPMFVGEERLCDDPKEHLWRRLYKCKSFKFGWQYKRILLHLKIKKRIQLLNKVSQSGEMKKTLKGGDKKANLLWCLTCNSSLIRNNVFLVHRIVNPVLFLLFLQTFYLWLQWDSKVTRAGTTRFCRKY